MEPAVTAEAGIEPLPDGPSGPTQAVLRWLLGSHSISNAVDPQVPDSFHQQYMHTPLGCQGKNDTAPAAQDRCACAEWRETTQPGLAQEE